METNNIDFVALDLETATPYKESICEVGLTIVRNGKIDETRSWLIQPPQNLYFPINISIHGITPEMTADSPTFNQVWSEIEKFVDNKIVVAHNTAFDMYALKRTLDYYNLNIPRFRYFCSLRTARKSLPGIYSYSLPNLCETLSIEFNSHHRAENDSKACAQVMLKCLESLDVSDFDLLCEKLRFNSGLFDGTDHTPQRAIKDYSNKKSINISDITPDRSKIDEDSYFYEKEVCFTGKFAFATRRDLLQAIADIGGVPIDKMRKTTNVLVVGQFDYETNGEKKLSSKQKKAMELIDKGQDLEILSEKEFYEYFGIPDTLISINP